jgi:hypothetical protein
MEEQEKTIILTPCLYIILQYRSSGQDALKRYPLKFSAEAINVIEWDGSLARVTCYPHDTELNYSILALR